MSLSQVINTAWISPEGKIGKKKKIKQTSLVHKGMDSTALIWMGRMNLWMSSKKLVYQLLSGHSEELRELWNSSKDVSPRRQTAHAWAEKKDQRIKVSGARTLLHTLKLTSYTSVKKLSILSPLLWKRKRNIVASRKIRITTWNGF